MHTIGVTGTNGKTSTCGFVHQLGNALGLQTASITTPGLTVPTGIELELDTSEPGFGAAVEAVRDAGIELFVAETVSQALATDLYDDHQFDGAVLLEISGDHLEMHGGFESYQMSKHRLIERTQPGAPIAVVTRLSTSAATIAASEAAGADLRRVGPGEPWDAIDADRPGPLRLRAAGEETTVECDLPPGFLRRNLVAAMAVTDGVLGRRDELVDAVPHVAAPPGRMELIATSTGAQVFVDNSHNPDGLRSALLAARHLAEGRLIVVFGCGGERDRAKRPLMGKVADQFADVVVVTDDNPRMESPAKIRNDILAACPRAVEIPDRTEAIFSALELLRSGDVLVVAGRGREHVRQIAGRREPHSDAAVIEAGLSALA